VARLVLRAQPASRREGFCGWFGDVPRFAVAARPVDGAANEALERGLAAALGLPRRSVRLIGGAGSRTKRFEVVGLDQDDLDRAVSALNPR
jgi:uncharacterized protein YggU (UPF0235/DUF167 family)